MRINRRVLLKSAVLIGPMGIGLHNADASKRISESRFAFRTQTTGEQQIFYNFSLLREPTSFDFNLQPDCGAEAATFSGLLTFDTNLNPVGDWASTWDVNEDATLYTFYLRQFNRGWSDGTPVTAHDFVWSWQRQLNPENGVERAGRLYDIKYARQIHTRTPVDDDQDPLHGRIPTVDDLAVEAFDDWTLQITLAGPRAHFPYVLACKETMPVPRWQIETHGNQWARGGDIPIVSNGPLKVDRWEPGVKVELSRNAGYWSRNSMKLATVVDPILAGDRAVAAYESDDPNNTLDWTELDTASFKRFSDDPVLAQQLQPALIAGIWMLLPQVTSAPFDSLVVRQALSHAIDRTALAAGLPGTLMSASCMVPPGMYGFLDEPSLAEIQQFDPEKAMALLNNTPYEGGKNWPEQRLTFAIDNDTDDAEMFAAVIADQLAEHLHLKVELQPVPESAFQEQLGEHAWSLVLKRWIYDYPDPNNGYGDIFYSRRTSARPQAWANPAFDDLIEQTWSEPDQRKRLTLYLQAEQLIQNDVGYIPLGYPLRRLAFKPWVRGVPINQAGFVAPDGQFMRRMLTSVYVEGRGVSSETSN